MELLQLTYFAESAKTESFSATAKKYMVPVSAVSSSVRKLERELGCTLFDREANKIKLNVRGRAFYGDINNALMLISSAKEKVSPGLHGDLGNINMLIRTNKSFIDKKLTDFIKENGNMSFHLTHSYSTVDYGEYDIIVDERSHVYKGYIQKPIIKEKIKIAACASNPLINKQLTLNDLRSCPFITMNEGSFLNTITKDVCRKAGFSPNIIIESDDSNEIKRYIKEDFGIAFVSETAFVKELNNGVCFLNVTDFDYNRITCLYLNDNIVVSKAAKMFFDHIAELG